LNGTPVENLSLVEARKQIDKSKDKLQLTVARHGSQVKPHPSPSSFRQHEQPGKLSNNVHISYLFKKFELYILNAILEISF